MGTGTGTRVTLQTIADRVGVSRMTVSNAFNKPDQLSADLRARVLQAADELGYTGPDPAARALARGSTGAVGVLLTSSPASAFTDEVAAAFFSSIAGALQDSGLSLTLISSQAVGDVVPARDVAMDGTIVYNCDPHSGAREQIERRRLPLVLVDQPDLSGAASVNIADREGARAAAQHLVDLGHTKFAFVLKSSSPPFGIADVGSAPGDGFAQIERVAGWLDVLTEHGLRPTYYRLQTGAEHTADGALAEILAAAPETTAILTYSDAVAAVILLDAQDGGIAVPEDLSIVGFDDSPLATRLRPELTTVRQDVPEKGRLAALMLVEQIKARAAGTTTTAEQVVLPVELVVRGSTGPPPAR